MFSVVMLEEKWAGINVIYIKEGLAVLYLWDMLAQDKFGLRLIHVERGTLVTSSRGYWKKAKPQHSKVKSKVVLHYFSIWSKIIGRGSHQNLMYIDLFAGKWKHQAGEPSTAYQVLHYSVKEPDLCRRLGVWLNDRDIKNVLDLKSGIDEEGIGQKLKQKLHITNEVVTVEMAKRLSMVKALPIFCFLDPYGFRGLSLDLIKSLTKNWGCDALIFFHTSGIVRNLSRPDLHQDLSRLFGVTDFVQFMRPIIAEFPTKHDAVLNAFLRRLRESGIGYSLELTFNFPKSRRVSHHLIAVTKSYRGFHVAKEVMSTVSEVEHGVPTYVYTEGVDRRPDQLSLSISGSPIMKVADTLLSTFRGQEIRVGDLLEECDRRGFRFTDRNVKHVLDLLDLDGQITHRTDSGKKRRRNTFGDKVIVVFPD